MKNRSIKGDFSFQKKSIRYAYPMLFSLLDPKAALLDGLERHRYDYVADIPEKLNENDRWLSASSLQKSIRRGKINEALFAAHVLKRLNESSLCNRLKVIALEDVGIANLDIVSQVLWVAGKREWRSKNYGEEHILSYLVCQLCRSAKCRSLDDVLYIADRHPHYASQRMIYSGMNEKELCDVFADEGSDVVQRTLACWYLAGTKRYRATNLQEKQGNPNIIFDLAHSVGSPSYVLDILKLAKGSEYFVCLLPCLMQLEQSKTSSIVSELYHDGVKIGCWPEYAYDRHTLRGKQAFRRFLKLCPEVLEFIQKYLPKADPVDLIGWTVFSLEGRMLDRRLIYDSTETILDFAVQSWMNCKDMDQVKQTTLLQSVQQNIDKLQTARQEVAEEKLHPSANSA